MIICYSKIILLHLVYQNDEINCYPYVSLSVHSSPNMKKSYNLHQGFKIFENLSLSNPVTQWKHSLSFHTAVYNNYTHFI